MLNRYQDVFKSLNSHGVKYVVIGGAAAIVHGVARATFDVDILIDPTRENAAALLAALVDAGFATAALTSPDNLIVHEITIFKDRRLLDVMTRIPGIAFPQAWDRRQTIFIGELPVHIISRGDLVAAKKASGRQKDLDDVAVLERPHRD